VKGKLRKKKREAAIYYTWNNGHGYSFLNGIYGIYSIYRTVYTVDNSWMLAKFDFQKLRMCQALPMLLHLLIPMKHEVRGKEINLILFVAF
jgi:lipoprotein signal peptidase